MGIQFDATISLGSILTIAGGIGTSIVAFTKLKTQFDDLKNNTSKLSDKVNDDIEAGQRLEVSVAVITEKLNSHEREISRARENIHILSNFLQQKINMLIALKPELPDSMKGD